MKILNSHIKNLLTSLLLMVGVFTGMQHAQAQQYPVQGFLSIIPPYPAQLSDYANPNINRLNLTLTLNDISVNNKRVRLKVFVLRQNSLFTQTSGNYFGDVPITLTSGIPEQLTSSELAGYFKFQNLQGIVPDSYAQPLGEGFMNIYFVVYDYFTGRQLSNKIEFPFFILLNDPPLLNLPLNGTHISNAGAANPQIAFSWTSRATQASNTDYIFTLSPIYDPTGDPFTQFLAAIPVYQTTISNQTNLLYGFAEPPLLPGKTYGWRIQAKAKAGFEDVGLYKQNGYSEIHTFTYDSPCITIADQDVTVEPRASDRLYASWVAPTDAGQQLTGGYMVAYRKYSAGGMWNWQEQTTQTPNYYITGLEPTTDYEVKVARICTDGTYTYTNPQKATTLAVNQLPIKIDCGKIPSIDISNQNPLLQLNSGDVVMAGDFPVTILRANNVAGLFSGEGWVKVPYLADTKIHVTYQNIKVNTDHKLIDGYFETSYKASGQNIASVDTALADVAALIKDVSELVKKVEDLLIKRKAFIDDYSGSDADKQQAVPLRENEDLVYKTVIQSSLLTQAEKDTLKQENTTVDDALGCIGNPTGGIKKGADDDEPTTCIQTYASATHLNKYKELIQQRADAEMLFKGDFFKIADKLDDKNTIDKYLDRNQKLNFVTPDGQIIQLPKDAEVSFGNYLINSGTNLSSSRSKDALGYLLAFKIDQKTYISNFNKGEFLGYFNHDSHDKNTKDLYGQIDKANIIAGIEYTQCQLLLEYGPYKEAIIDNFDKAEQITFIDGNFEVLGSEQVGNQDCILCSIPNDKKPKPVNDLLTELPSHPDGGGNVSSLASAVGDQDMQNFICADDRFKIIKNIANNKRVDGNDEKTIIRLMQTTPDNQVQALMDAFKNDNSGLLAALFSSIDNASLNPFDHSHNLDDFYAQFSLLYQKYLGVQGIATAKAVIDAREKDFLTKSTTNGCSILDEFAVNGIFITPHNPLKNGLGDCNVQTDGIVSKIENNGDFKLAYYGDKKGIVNAPTIVSIRPFDLYKVYFIKDGSVEPTAAYLPGYSVRWLINNYDNQSIAVGVNKGILIGSTLTFVIGGSIVAELWASVDMVISSGNLYIINEQDELSKTPAGRDFVKNWNTLNSYIVVAQGASMFYGIGKNITQFSLALKDLKSTYSIWRAIDLESLRLKNPSLADKLDRFGKYGILNLEKLEAQYQIKLQKLSNDFKIQSNAAEQLLADERFLKDYNSGIYKSLSNAGENIIEIHRIRGLTKEERIAELGFDPKKGQLDRYEGEIGAISEASYGYFKRYTNSAEGDFVSLSGQYKNKVFDAFGLPEKVTTYPNYDINKFFPSIDKHFLNKPNVDFLILDMRYMNSLQKDAVNNYIKSKFTIQIDRLIILK